MTPLPRSAAWLAWASALGLVTPLVALTTAPTATAAAPPAVRAVVGGESVWAHFTNPRTHAGRDTTIQDEVVRLIEATPGGATIKGTIYSLTVQPVSRALVAAQRRGVHVQILLDGDNATSRSPAVAIIRHLRGARFCTYKRSSYGSAKRAGGACISTSDDGDLHVKMFTFSRTRDPQGNLRGSVSWFGSANMTYASGADQFNNAVTVYGDVSLAHGLDDYFADLWHRRHYRGDDYYNFLSARGVHAAPAASFYASPEGRHESDTIAARLDDLTPDAHCQMRIGMAFVTAARPQLLRVVTRAAEQGCHVSMVVSSSGGKIRMPRAVYLSLLRAGVAIRRVNGVHDKYFAVYAKEGRHYRYRVYTGSQNWSGSALTSNDELFLKLTPEPATAHPLYDGYRRHFADAWAAGKACRLKAFPCR